MRHYELVLLVHPDQSDQVVGMVERYIKYHLAQMLIQDKSWVALDVPQCGYCQSGQIMSAAALLEQSPKPTDEEINGAMAGNICRCGAYQRIHAAIKVASGQAPADASPQTDA